MRFEKGYKRNELRRAVKGGRKRFWISGATIENKTKNQKLDV